MKEIKIGIIGFGTVGAGVVEGILKNGDLMAERTGIRPVVTKIADLDITTDRGISLPEGVLTTDANAVIEDPSIDLIVELVGGTTLAKTFTLHALRQGKAVITANKALLAEHGAEIYATAQENNTGIYYEAAVGGGIPILRSQRAGLVGNQIEHIYGILNGTCNYILTRMEREGLAFDSVLADAQKLGYAETPPDLDIDGIDTAHKAVILTTMAYGAPVPLSACSVKGIRGLNKLDIEEADALGFRIKLMAIVRKDNGTVALSVEPTLVPKEHLAASVSDSFNAVFVRGDLVGDTMFYGRGAGRLPTGSAVIGDIMEAAADQLNKTGTPTSVSMMIQRETIDLQPPEEQIHSAYIRLTTSDLPAVQSVFEENQIEVDRVESKEKSLVFITKPAKRVQYTAALNRLEKEGVVTDAPVCFRVEMFEE